MGKDWYEMIARKLGGYQKNWNSTVVGLSGEKIFEQRLISLLKDSSSALDAGCAHGEFTLRMASFAKKIYGFDFAPEMIKNAHKLLGQSDIRNVKFFHAIAKELPFADDQFDLIYSRRGPISFLCESRILQHGGIVIGIHSGAKEEVTKRLAENHFTAIHMEEFEAYEHFPTKQDFARFYSRIPGNPDYLAPENSSLLEELIQAHTTAEGLVFRQWRYIWQAIKK